MSIHSYTALRLDDTSPGFTADSWEPRALRIEADKDCVITVHLTSSQQVRDAMNVLRGIEDHFIAAEQADDVAPLGEIRRGLTDDDRYFNHYDATEVA